jgi:membrane protein implicated in regulation of membrane protease activity
MKYLSVIIILIFGIAGIIATGFVYGWIFLMASLPIWIIIIIFLGAIAISIAFIYVGIQRIQEIKKEDQNDLSKY